MPPTQPTAEVIELVEESAQLQPAESKKCHTKKLVGAGAITISLLLIIAAICMHLKQKHHLGRLNIDQVAAVPGVAALELDTEPDTESVTDDCLRCIQATATDYRSVMCGEYRCGVYRISKMYWQDAKRNVWLPEVEDYETCVRTGGCDEAIVRSYLKLYERDCNGDGIVNCEDFIRLHVQGPGGCRTKPLSTVFEQRMYKCLIDGNLA